MGDSDTFYRLFGKPTLIYRYLRTQHLVSPLFLHRNLSYVKTRQEKSRRTRSTFRLENFQKLKQERVINNAKEKEVDLELVTMGVEQIPKNGEDPVLKIELCAKNSLVEIPLDSFTLRAKGQQHSFVLSSRKLKKEGFVDLECMELLVRVAPGKEMIEPEAKRPRVETMTAIITPFKASYSIDGEYHFPLKEPSAESNGSKLNWEETPYIRIKFRWRKKTSNSEKNGIAEDNKENVNKDSKSKKILYYYNAGTHSVQTQALSGHNCPWCNIDCRQITSLVMHLKHNHFRFKYAHVEKPDYHCIEVSVNEHFDGSFAGNPQRTALHPSSNRRKRPLRCLARSEVIVWNNKKQRQNGDLDDDSEHQRPSIFGHQRLYYHTGTCMPIGSEGIDVDSEGEIDPEWLQVKTQMMIDEFTDVNPGEKEMWKMWNLFKMKHNFVGDKQMAYALNQFVTSCGTTLVKRDMVRNFLVHISGFFDFGVTTQYTTLRSVCDLRSLLAKDPELRKQFAQSVQKQVAFAKESRKEEVPETTVKS